MYRRITAEVEKIDDSLREEIKSLDFKIEASATQDSIDVLQESVTNLTRQIANLSTLVQQQRQAPPNANNAANLHGGRGFADRKSVV